MERNKWECSLIQMCLLSMLNATSRRQVVPSAPLTRDFLLVSGINSAKDDAAGLSISTRMGAQIRGYGMATRNINDGISLVQTAEGALQETTSILQRMRELAVQGANDVNTAADRESINGREITQLKAELDKIGDTTTFNTQNVLDGSFIQRFVHVGSNANEAVNISIEIHGQQRLDVLP